MQDFDFRKNIYRIMNALCAVADQFVAFRRDAYQRRLNELQERKFNRKAKDIQTAGAYLALVVTLATLMPLSPQGYIGISVMLLVAIWSFWHIRAVRREQDLDHAGLENEIKIARARLACVETLEVEFLVHHVRIRLALAHEVDASARLAKEDPSECAAAVQHWLNYCEYLIKHIEQLKSTPGGIENELAEVLNARLRSDIQRYSLVADPRQGSG